MSFCDRPLGSVRFHPDFNRPLIALWDQRHSSPFVICCRKWISGRLKSHPDRSTAGSIVEFRHSNTLTSEVLLEFTHPIKYTPHSMARVSRVSFCDRPLGSVRFHPDFNRPLIPPGSLAPPCPSTTINRVHNPAQARCTLSWKNLS